ncbi:MAG: outer membrane beta-barrel protein [Ferruginibacter sp.]
MNKRPYNQVEEQIKAAAEGWEPAFDEQAWERMEQMLEKDDDRRRPVAWWLWLLPLILGLATAGYFISRSDKGTAQVTAADKKPVQQSQATVPTTTNETTAQPAGAAQSSMMPAGLAAASQYKQSVAVRVKTSAGTIQNDDAGSKASGKGKRKNIAGRAAMHITAASLSGDEETGNPADDKMAVQTTPGTTDVLLVITNTGLITDAKKDSTPSATIAAVPAEKKEGKKEEQPAGKNKTTDSSVKYSSFYFSLYAGMEGNGVNFPGLNKFSPRAGFTAGYYFDKRWSVQAGFFAGTKKYVAGQSDYKAKPGSYWSMVDITRVNADCRVFEIPVSVRYDFNSGKKTGSFAGIGLSSYIMDKEDYAYNYIRNNNPYYAEASYTGNRHWFSVLRLYGGIEKKVSNGISLGIQPGLAIPLKGVGEGQIRLFSSELLFSLKYRPFKKIKSNQ